MKQDFFVIELPLDNLSQQDHANFLHNQRLSKIASPCILGGRVNQTDVSNTNNVFTPPSTPVKGALMQIQKSCNISVFI